MAQPQILVLADEDVSLALTLAGFSIAGDDNVRRQTAAVVIDVRGAAGARAGELAQSIKSALGPRAGLFFAWSDTSSSYDAEAFDGALDASATLVSIAARLNSSLRIAVMADEAKLRFKSLAKFGGAPKPPQLALKTKPRILIFGPPGPELMRFTAGLEARGAVSISALTSFTAFDYLHDGDFDGVAIIAHDDMPTSLRFCSALRRNARLFHMPCLVMGSPDFACPEDAIARGATDFAVSGDDDDVAAERLLDFVDEKRSRDALVLAFAAARAPAAMDQGTGLYTSEFFASHLDRLTARAHETDRPLSITLVRIAPNPLMTALAKGRGLDRIVGQAGAMMSHLVRAEDVAARIDRTTFAVAFPSSDEEAAEIAARRIGAVLECTAFDSGTDVTAYSNDAPLQLKLDVACANLLAGDAAHSLITRAQARLPLDRL